ncbi:MAG TPA: DUF5985 family protein [Candidatus Angelobacter sp.]|jgi:hypothetical protein|nr:DUF5985 family protein [Candidatus Angelobacter sp.]
MGPAVYILGTLVTLACGALLIRAYARVHKRLLLWSGICFFGLAANNFLVLLDLVIFPQVDLYTVRLLTAAVSMLVLLYGLVWEGGQ